MCATHVLEGRGTQNQNKDQQSVPILNLVFGCADRLVVRYYWGFGQEGCSSRWKKRECEKNKERLDQND